MAAVDVGGNPTNNNNTNKRKRAGDQDVGRNAKLQNTNGEHDAYSALLQGLDPTGAEDDSTRTAQAALAAPMNQSAYPEHPTFVDGAAALSSAFDEGSPSALPNLGSAQALIDARGNQSNKPAVGTAEWHQQRKDNHKEGKIQLAPQPPTRMLT
jgi:bHLH factor